MNKKIIPSCGNIFEDLGFPPDEAAAMLAHETRLVEQEKELKKCGKPQELTDERRPDRAR